MDTRTLKGAFASGLQQLRAEVEAYPADEALWRHAPGINNCGGTLALHQVYSLRYLVGAALGGIPREWRREEAFTLRDVSRAELLREIDETIDVVRRSLDGLDPARLEEDYPVDVGAPRPVSTETFLLHLAMHTAYHNGQLNYHRRLVAQDGAAEHRRRSE